MNARIFWTLLFAAALSTAVGAQDATGRYANMREALNALKSAKDDAARKRIYQQLPQVPVRDHADIMALYGEARSRQDKTPLLASDAALDAYVRDGQTLTARLKGCTDPALQDDVAGLIDKERKSWHKFRLPLMPIGKMGQRDAAQSLLRLTRVRALFDAAGDGKNEKSRAALWRVVDDVGDSYFGQVAVMGLGKIGNPQDLDKLIVMLEQNPHLYFQLNDFGTKAIAPLLDAVGSQIVPDKQARVALGLIQVATHDDLQAYVPLLHDKNMFIARAAREAIGKNLRSGDEDLIRSMLKDPSVDVQVEALNAIDANAWDEKFIPLLIDDLRGGDEAAASVLGHHKVKAAVPALEEAVKSPKVSMQGEARYALRAR